MLGACIDILSGALGAVVAALFYFNDLPFFINVVWIAFAVAAAVLLVLLLLLQFGRYRSCLHSYASSLLFGAAGTLLSALAALSVYLAPFSVAAAIIVFFVTAFFLFLLFMIFAFICCMQERSV